MSDTYEDLLEQTIRAVNALMDGNDAARCEVMKDGLKISVGVGWPEVEDELEEGYEEEELRVSDGVRELS